MVFMLDIRVEAEDGGKPGIVMERRRLQISVDDTLCFKYVDERRRDHVSHPPGNLNAHEIERPCKGLANQINGQDIKQPPVRVFLGDDPIAVIEETEPLCERESVFCQCRRLQGSDHLVGYLIEAKREVKQFPNVVGFIKKGGEFRMTQKLLDAAEIEIGLRLA